MDMTMPGPSGSEVIRQIRELNTGAWIIAMSGGMSAGSAKRYHAMRAGADICLEKPFDPAELLDAIGFMNRAQDHRHESVSGLSA
jgi:DNA-binding response OmpR family regulator